MVTFAFIRVAVHFAGDDLLVELAIVLDGIVVAVGQDARSKLLFAVIAIEANDWSL